MATSTEQINNLIGGYTGLKGYFEGARDAIDQDLADMRTQVDSFTADVRNSFRTRVYANRLSGDDAADGSAANPVASFAEAVSRAPEGGLLEIYLTGNMVMDRRVLLPSGAVHIRSDDTSVRRRIVFEGEDIYEEDQSMPRFFSPYVGVGLMFNAIEFVMGTSTANVTGTRHAITCNGLTNVLLRDCELEAAAGSDQALLGLTHGGGLGLHATSAPTAMDGLWIEGVAAGTAPGAVEKLAWTNLTSL